MPTAPFLLETQEDVDIAARLLRQSRVVAIDLETTGLDPHSDHILLVAVKGENTPVYLYQNGLGLDFNEVLLVLENKVCLAHNAVFEFVFLDMDWTLTAPSDQWYCTQVAEALLTNGLAEKRASLGEVAEKYCGVMLDKTQQTSFVGVNPATFAPTSEQLAYAAEDVAHLHDIMAAQLAALRAEGLLRVARLEFALIPALADMQLKGFRLDLDSHAEVLSGYTAQEAELRQSVTARLDALYQQRWVKVEAERAQLHTAREELLHKTLELAGITRLAKDTDERVREKVLDLRKLRDKTKPRQAAPINLQSSEQVLDALEEAGIVLEKQEGGAVKRSLDKNVVADYLKRHPDGVSVLHEYARWTKLNKVLTTYGDTLRGQVHAVTGRVHSSYNPMGTDSGRFASEKPNMQNVPPAIRACFAAEEGNTLVVADAKNQEGRIAAALSGDKQLLAIFREDQDWHCMTAAVAYPEKFRRWEDVPKESKERAGCKNANFSSIYGGTAYTLYSRGYVPSLEVGERLMAAVAALAPRLVEWTGEVATDAVSRRYASTISGRKRFFPPPANKSEVGALRRAAMNHPVQGSGADIMKQAMVLLLRPMRALGYRAVATVHDELVYEGPTDKAQEAATLVGRVMEEAARCFISALPVPAEVHVTERWVK